MAEELGIDATNYSRLERGEAKIPIERLEKIATILQVDLKALILDNQITEVGSQEASTNAILLAILMEMRAIRTSLNNLELNKYGVPNIEIDSNQFTNLQ